MKIFCCYLFSWMNTFYCQEEIRVSRNFLLCEWQGGMIILCAQYILKKFVTKGECNRNVFFSSNECLNFLIALSFSDLYVKNHHLKTICGDRSADNLISSSFNFDLKEIIGNKLAWKKDVLIGHLLFSERTNIQKPPFVWCPRNFVRHLNPRKMPETCGMDEWINEFLQR